jgi:signal peptidase II
MKRGLSKWTLLAAIVAVMLVADQWTKFLAVERLTFAFQRFGLTTPSAQVAGFYRLRHLEGAAREPYVVWKPVWRMSYAENPGAAWGLFRDLPDGLRNAFFFAISAAAVGFILWYYRKLRRDQRWLQVALALVLSGALGNLADRIARGYVVDFVNWHWWNRPDLYWPTFNVADSLIVIGVAMLLVHPGERKGEAAAGKKDGTAGVGG